MLKLISNLISYLKNKRKIQALSEILFSYLKKIKKIYVVLGSMLIFFIFFFFSIKESSDLDQNEKVKISVNLDEKKKLKSDDLSENTEVEIEKLKNKQATKDDLSKSKKSPEKKEKKPAVKNQRETQQKKKALEPNKKAENKNEINKFYTPEEVVNNLHTGLKKVSEKISDSPTDLINLVKNTYNAEKMITKIIGDTWKKTNKKDQQEIVIIFQEYIAKNYFKRFKKITNPTFKYKESKKISEKLMLIKTILVVDKEEVSINYLLIFDKNQWRIFDVLLAGSISEIATKKSEFSSFIRDGKISPLIDALKKQNSALND
jgi:phospholipid transport system substrate-binding protein